MQNKDKWRPSKYIFRKGKLAASRDLKKVGAGSRLITALIARAYETNLKTHARGKLIDLGCGYAPLYEAYKPYVSDNICVDWPQTAHKNQYLDYEQSLCEPLPFPENEFDTIILSDVLEHIPEPEKLWQEMARILKPSGKLLLNVPFYYRLHESPYDYHRYTEYALRQSALSNGLTVRSLNPIGGTPEILADILAKHFTYLPIIGVPLALAIQKLTWFFINTRIGKKVSAKTAKNFPFAYFMVAEKNT